MVDPNTILRRLIDAEIKRLDTEAEHMASDSDRDQRRRSERLGSYEAYYRVLGFIDIRSDAEERTT
ncbi:hypothetical protein [Haloglycomyces albus]|uniref:hypothetical protein n=1 Tax=Haloglycomyces albus TaxID=526067 RepID=UPI00046D9555|nr:hypothetical protein [Haloglycomyces albus]